MPGGRNRPALLFLGGAIEFAISVRDEDFELAAEKQPDHDQVADAASEAGTGSAGAIDFVLNLGIAEKPWAIVVACIAGAAFVLIGFALPLSTPYDRWDE